MNRWCHSVMTYILQVCACLLLGVSIWMAVDRNFMTYIIGNNLYAAAVFIVLGSCAIIFFVSFLGCCGVVKEQLFMLFVVSVICMTLFLLQVFVIIYPVSTPQLCYAEVLNRVTSCSN